MQTVFDKTRVLRILVLIVISLLLSMLFWGTDIVLKKELTSYVDNGASITFKSWHVVTGVFLLLLHGYVFLREWYHSFKRETRNLEGLVLSIILLAYLAIMMYPLTRLDHKSILLQNEMLEKDLLSINEYPVLKFQLLSLFLFCWTCFVLLLFSVKLYKSLRKHNDQSGAVSRVG